jgi:hypothetical protein
MRHDPVPHAGLSPAAKTQVGMVPVAQFRRDRAPFGTVVEAPDNGLDRAPVFLARACPTQLDRGGSRFEFAPLGVGQYCHRLSPVILPGNRKFSRFAKY